MPKIQGKRALSIDISASLYIMFSKLCVELEITKTEAITQYLRYLQKQDSRNRKILNEHSEPNFKLDARKPK